MTRALSRGVSTLALVSFAAVYTLLPADLVPDAVPVIGWLDDLLMIGLTAGFAVFLARGGHVERHRRTPVSTGLLARLVAIARHLV